MKTTVLPDGSTLKPGEVIYRMQRPLHGQTVNLRSGPVQTMKVTPAQIRNLVRLAMAEEFRLEALQPQPDGFVGGKGYCSASSICRAHPDIPYHVASTALRNNAIKNIKSVQIDGRGHVAPADVAKAVSELKKLS